MSSDKLRRQVAWEAARLMYQREETEYFRAKMKAARRIASGEFKPGDLPSNAEIRDQVQSMARMFEGRRREEHLHVADRFPFELTLYAADLAHYVFKSSITGKAIQRASIAELEQLLAREYPEMSLEQAVLEAENRIDRFQIYEMLLLPLEKLKGSRTYHPEGDALYHSLQVFELARQESPYDEEFLLAALLHDVGKAIDPQEHVAAALEALDGFITPRTAWLIEHHMEAHRLLEGTIGARCRRRLEASDDFEELKLLARCDRDGRQRGAAAPELDEALAYLRDLAEMCGE